MNTRTLEPFQHLPDQHTDSGEEPAEGSLLWAADQLRRIALMLEDMQARRGDAPLPPAATACTCLPAAREDSRALAETPLYARPATLPRTPLAPEAGHVVQ